MRQLTSLDTQFPALKNGRTHGHVNVLGIYEPQTASGRPLDAAPVRELVSLRLHASVARNAAGADQHELTGATP